VPSRAMVSEKVPAGTPVLAVEFREASPVARKVAGGDSLSVWSQEADGGDPRAAILSRL
jgi:hypothetical protein